ncbi:hypothetical protein FB192DRAFT_1065220 [Mucor lusitanicus]|uniref:Uncharacterized protein n=1 Tax=Mucor circinelloides f. lusitanicus TaxID=29924 RepID=A0A8H4BQN8_MUCCL|nr:hypothetical protein FB192DRAFT_1065220 [Mucor lusitanicus]
MLMARSLQQIQINHKYKFIVAFLYFVLFFLSFLFCFAGICFVEWKLYWLSGGHVVVEAERQSKKEQINLRGDLQRRKEEQPEQGCRRCNDTKTRSGTNVRRAKGGEDVEGDKQQRWTREALQNEIIVREAQKDDDAINTDINEAEERVMALKEELKAALKEFDDGKFGQQIKEKKMTWIPGVKNDALYEEIEQLKVDRDSSFWQKRAWCLHW